jgi:hypothetical protein
LLASRSIRPPVPSYVRSRARTHRARSVRRHGPRQLRDLRQRLHNHRGECSAHVHRRGLLVLVQRGVQPLWGRLRPVHNGRERELRQRACSGSTGVCASYRARAEREGIRRGQSGAVTFVQRFGGSLNLNVHFHTAFLDGVFFRDDHDPPFCAITMRRLCDHDGPAPAHWRYAQYPSPPGTPPRRRGRRYRRVVAGIPWTPATRQTAPSARTPHGRPYQSRAFPGPCRRPQYCCVCGELSNHRQ